MNYKLTILLMLLFSLAVVAPGRASDPDTTRLEDLSPEERKQRIRDQIEARRQQHMEVMLRSPGVWQPGSNVAASDFATIEWKKVPVGLVAQFYASLIQREVMVSFTAARFEVTLVQSGMSRQDAIAAVERAIGEAGILIVAVGDNAVAFIGKKQ